MRTCRILENAGARILGVALNKLDLRNQDYDDGNVYNSRYYRKSPYGSTPSNPA